VVLVTDAGYEGSCKVRLIAKPIAGTSASRVIDMRSPSYQLSRRSRINRPPTSSRALALHRRPTLSLRQIFLSITTTYAGMRPARAIPPEPAAIRRRQAMRAQEHKQQGREGGQRHRDYDFAAVAIAIRRR